MPHQIALDVPCVLTYAPSMPRLRSSLLIIALGAALAHADVTTTLSGSSLVVTGDSSPDVVTIAGAPDGIVVSGSNGTLVDGSAVGVSVPGVEKLTVKLRQGDDRLTLMNVTLSQGITVRLGRGNDSVEFDEVYGGAVTIQTGNGYDGVFVYGPSTLNNLWVGTSNGDDLVVVGGTWVRGDVNIDTGADDDQVHVVATQIGDDLDVHMGNDDDVLVLEDVTVDDHAHLDGDDGNDALFLYGYLWFGDDLDIDGFGDDDWWW